LTWLLAIAALAFGLAVGSTAGTLALALGAVVTFGGAVVSGHLAAGWSWPATAGNALAATLLFQVAALVTMLLRHRRASRSTLRRHAGDPVSGRRLPV
jgi:hypothetical protein